MTVTWQAARNGFPGDSNAGDHASQVDQFLATHGVTPVYRGNPVILPTNGEVGYGLGDLSMIDLGGSDIDQPFPMRAGTTVGRVTLPLVPVGNGADVTVSLWSDQAGAPGTVITSTRIPASWITQLAAVDGLAAAGPLGLAQSNALLMNDMTQASWASPAAGSFGAGIQSAVQSGNYMILLGGQSTSASAASAGVWTFGWSGGTVLDSPQPQPPLPQATSMGAAAATPDTVIYAGGNSIGTSSTTYANVWAAGWDPNTGQVSSWSAQTALPQALTECVGTAWGQTVYVIGGQNSTNTNVTTVYFASVTNGQVGPWRSGPPLPVALNSAMAEVVGNWLIVTGGNYLVSANSYSPSAATYCAPINADGSLGPWQNGPALPNPAAAGGQGTGSTATASGVVLFSNGGAIQTLTVGVDGPAPVWQSQAANWNPNANPVLAEDQGDGTWRVFSVDPSSADYWTGVMSSVPVTSVPLPAPGLSAGVIYHILIQQNGGDVNNYTALALDPSALPIAANTRPAGGGAWTAQPNGYAALAGVYDLAPGGRVLHTWQDAGARITAMLYSASTGRLLGVCESAPFADGSLLSAVTQVTYQGSAPVATTQLA